MASAKKCDICGEFYELYNVDSHAEKTNGFMFLNIDSRGKYFTHKAIDCCPNCMSYVRVCISNKQKGLVNW